ncbi:MAG: ATP-binding cassette domain-containing protein [Treponema sp.]|jgi:peptide/nickel transport system ATP-binding protein/oligopeptide transport system ATP-binding protein|nr:ATP-binding cassette domain-containing protein [Treponema sp.]
MIGNTLVSLQNVKKHYNIRRGVFGKHYQVRAVDGVSFDVRQGEVFGIVGESGCGKSTLGRMICRLESITEGDIDFDGDNLAGISDRKMLQLRRKVQMIFQDPYSSLNPRMTVSDIVGEPFIVHKLAKSNADREKKVLSLLNDVGLASYHANRYPHEFSGGQRQRIGIARALAVRPKLIIADEPVSALDVSIQSQVLNLLNKIKKEYDLTFIFISHNLTVVEFFSDRIGVMYLGSMVEVASKDALYRNPLHPYTQALMAAIPVMDPHKRKPRQLLEGTIPSAINPPPGCKFHTRCPHCAEICKTKAPLPRVISGEQYVYCHLYDK